MRITGGILRGRRLITPKSPSIRPMRDAVRAALFSILGDLVSGSRFLDLFAGTGSVGIEALSRGAKHAVFVDNSAEAVKIIEENLHNLGLEGQATVYREDVFKALQLLSRRDEQFDLVFIGPPYGEDLARRTLEHLAYRDILSEGAVVAAEIFKKEGTGFERRYGELVLFDERAYGDNLIKLYRREV
jgi:16S rRNA (guanine(966)-N(2))-methyltransferase RsmD